MSIFYVDIASVDEFARQQGQNERWDDLDETELGEKTYIVSLASRDIENLHGLMRPSHNIPADQGNPWFKEACMYQALHVMRTIGPREFIERAKLMATESYSDGVVSFSRPGKITFDETAEALVMDELAKKGMINQAAFGRG